MITRLQKLYADVGTFKETHEFRLTTADKKTLTDIRRVIKVLEKELSARMAQPKPKLVVKPKAIPQNETPFDKALRELRKETKGK